MSGTSFDAVDVALIETDGVSHVTFLAAQTFPYDPLFRRHMRDAIMRGEGTPWLEEQITKKHATAVAAFLRAQNLATDQIDLIGFHGQTLWHKPKKGQTLQLGDGAMLAALTGIDVVNDFRSADMNAGGQGAPLVPLYHRALAQEIKKPLAVVNIGGVANITWIGSERDKDLVAFDTGPGNALLDDWVLEHTGQPFDKDGALAAKGCVSDSYMELFFHHPYFKEKPPKSLDRGSFINFVPQSLSLEDGAATLTMMTIEAIAIALRSFPKKTEKIYLAGGGRHNKTMISWLAERTGAYVGCVEELGWRGDSLEAEAFAYLAVRSVKGLPLTLPRTTGARKPTKGGRYYKH